MSHNPSPAEVAQGWTMLNKHLDKWFATPDHEAVAVVLSVAATHLVPEENPVWLFIVGAPGTGKTEVCIKSLLKEPGIFSLGDLTPNTFLSGWHTSELNKGGLLHEIGSATVVFKDFTTILSKRQDTLQEIAAQLREIHDGSFAKNTGSNTPKAWHGKITAIAATTDIIDRAWTMLQECGDRFVMVRWPRPNDKLMAEKAIAQVGHEHEIENATGLLASEVLHKRLVPAPAPLADPFKYGLPSLAELVVHLRIRTGRNSYGSREIVTIAQPEGAGRISKAVSQIARSHASLWRRQITEDDVKIGKRVAMDSLPPLRRAVFMHMKDGIWYDPQAIALALHLPLSAVKWTCEELEAAAAAECDVDTQTYKITDRFAVLRKEALT